MVFYIIDQGKKIEPAYASLFKKSGLKGVQAINPTRTVQKNKENEPTVEPVRQKIHTYQNTESESPTRKRIHYAHQIMTAPAITLKENHDLGSAWRCFQEHRFRHIPVMTNENQLIGILSDRDLLSSSASFFHPSPSPPSTQKVKSIMSTQVITASEKTRIEELADLMFRRKIGCIPITEFNGALVGVVTRGDILKLLVHQAPFEFWS